MKLSSILFCSTRMMPQYWSHFHFHFIFGTSLLHPSIFDKIYFKIQLRCPLCTRLLTNTFTCTMITNEHQYRTADTRSNLFPGAVEYHGCIAPVLWQPFALNCCTPLKTGHDQYRALLAQNQSKGFISQKDLLATNRSVGTFLAVVNKRCT